MPDERPTVAPLVALLPIVAQIVALLLLGSVLVRPGTEDAFFSPAFGVTLLGSYAVLVAATLHVARSAGPIAAVLALGRTPFWPAAGLIAAGSVAAGVAAQLLEPLFHGIRDQDIAPGRSPGGTTAAIGVTLVVIGIAIVGPVAEELYFRGVVQGSLGRFGTAIAIAGSSALFAAAHFQPSAIPVIAVYGVVLAVIRARTRSTWPGIVMHVLNNAFVVALALA